MNDPRRIEAALAHNLRDWRARRGWTQAELAARAGLSKGMLVQIEQSQTNPSIATLCKLANALGVALPRLVEVADEPRIRHVGRDDVAWLWQGRGRGSGAGLIGGIETPVPVELWEWKMGPIDAYEAVDQWIAKRNRQMTASPREVYFADFMNAGPDDEVVDIAFPVV